MSEPEAHPDEATAAPAGSDGVASDVVTVAAQAAETTEDAGPSDESLVATPRYRPTRRPPMAVLRVHDDDQVGYEAIRVRQTPLTIGRQDGDIVIGHERQMSRRHARIDRVLEGDAWRWYLGDLRSTNGTFLRVAQATLDDLDELLLGGELLRFHERSDRGDAWLERIAPNADEETAALPEPGPHLVGTDAERCLPLLRDAPYLEPRHFRVEQDAGRWRVVDLGSVNHLWIGIRSRTELHDGAEFQIGEQRFTFLLP